MLEPVVNPASEKVINSIIDNLPQSLLLTGDDGVGLSTISRYIAQMRKIVPIVILPEKDEKIDIEKGIISVGIIRRLHDDTRTKSSNERIIIIDYAERMTVQAQNSFLKLLEEPGLNIHFILVSHSISKLLPTILSRVEKIEVRPITYEQSEGLLDTLEVSDKIRRSQLLFIAKGRPAELIRLSRDESYFNQKTAIVRDAREYLKGNVYQKLLIAQKYKDDRSLALELLNNSANILQLSIAANLQSEMIELIDNVLKAYQRIEANGNIRLCLANLSMV
jgi:DNA polymerase III delta prime subunit